MGVRVDTSEDYLESFFFFCRGNLTNISAPPKPIMSFQPYLFAMGELQSHRLCHVIITA